MHLSKVVIILAALLARAHAAPVEVEGYLDTNGTAVHRLVEEYIETNTSAVHGIVERNMPYAYKDLKCGSTRIDARIPKQRWALEEFRNHWTDRNHVFRAKAHTGGVTERHQVEVAVCNHNDHTSHITLDADVYYQVKNAMEKCPAHGFYKMLKGNWSIAMDLIGGMAETCKTQKELGVGLKRDVDEQEEQ